MPQTSKSTGLGINKIGELGNFLLEFTFSEHQTHI